MMLHLVLAVFALAKEEGTLCCALCARVTVLPSLLVLSGALVVAGFIPAWAGQTWFADTAVRDKP